MKAIRLFVFILLIVCTLQTKSQNHNFSVVGCLPATSYNDLDIGNVRARLFVDGQMWHDSLGAALYEVPFGSGKHSFRFQGLWIGGQDAASNIKLAAQTEGIGGNDFWPGTLDTLTASIQASSCLQYDRFWELTRQEVASFINGASATQTIIDWPGNGNPANNESRILAPFYDQNGDGIYDYTNGDYPKYEFGIQSSPLSQKLNGDQTIWWVFNDVGNIHTGSNCSSTGIEVQAQAYAFCTSDSTLNNTTFYTYKFINRSTQVLYKTFIGNFVDPDLGNPTDDFIGCDVQRNLGFVYNGDNDDDVALGGYGSPLAFAGFDILSGITGDSGNQILMSRFISYNNDFSVTGNPVTCNQFYNYLDGIWKDGSRIVFGGTGYQSSTDSCLYMFPDNSDPLFIGTNGIPPTPSFDWSEKVPGVGQAPNVPGDRTFLMSTGPFTFLPGEINEMTTSAVWAKNISVSDLSPDTFLNAVDKIQNFFNSNFSSIPVCNVNIGVDDILNSGFAVFPTIAFDFIYIQINSQSKLNQISIYSIDGKLVYQSGNISSSSFQIHIAGWDAGLYLLNYFDGNNRTTKKINVLN